MTSEQKHEWVVALRPEGMNEGTNNGGLVISLTDGDVTHEVSRVLFVRRNSRNRNATFKNKLIEEIHKARLAADFLNEHDVDVTELKDELAERRRQLNYEERARLEDLRADHQRHVRGLLSGHEVERAA